MNESKSETLPRAASRQEDWRSEFFEFEDVAYLNAAAQGPLPRAAVRAAQQALEWKKLPHRLPEDAYFGLPDAIRALLAPMIGGTPEEIAITTGASSGLATIAQGIEWRPDDEVLVAAGEFPAHFATFASLAKAGRLRLRIVEPGAATGGRFLSADDFLPHIGPKTRLVSTSLVRFGDGTRIDAAPLAEACRAAGALLALDVSQCAGAMPLNARALGADFLVCAGYKWLLSPFGTGFFWVRRELMDSERFCAPGPFYWMALENAHEFHTLARSNWQPVKAARRWDAPETASFLNLAPMRASLELIGRVGVEAIWRHCRALAVLVVERLPRDRCLLASPADAEARGPYVCVRARAAERTQQLYDALCAERIFVSLREGALRIAPHLYNTERDVDRLLRVLSI
jgi:cysteine desulfurase / selenocysteine lyase